MAKSQVVTQLGEVTNTCFVVMPFASMFDREYSRVIVPAIENSGLTAVRGDEIYAEQAIVQDIWKALRASRVVVAELSGRNPNVMYEVGLAHAIGKPIVLLTRNQEDVPFDLRALRYLYYDTNNPEWGSDLRVALGQMIRRVIEEPELSIYLKDVKVETRMPKAPEGPIVRSEAASLPASFTGLWQASWLSIQKEREHTVVLQIPENHGREFSATATITYWKDQQQTVVVETLKGSLPEDRLTLIGVNYTYLQRGASTGYSLDRFNVSISESGDALLGNVTLKHGTRAVKFRRMESVLPTEVV
ncbi:MAG: hypothetical protein FJY37_04600 [Betaproteobacteria bacterium]|nr:hypothetical protein [Betaproteobacteria bacterium]